MYWMLYKKLLPAPVVVFLLKQLPVSHDAAADAMRNGPLASAMMHPIFSGNVNGSEQDFLDDPKKMPQLSRWPEHFESFLAEIKISEPANRSHVLLIQAESFFDIREHLHGEQQQSLKDFLPNWDRLKSMGRTLPTPENAYGAYTMRTEFSVLTGLQMEDIGTFAHNPYLLAGRQPMWSLARLFQSRGYETLCLHPYYKGFFRRDKVMPNLGFSRFWGSEELKDLDRFGPYASDLALGEKILKEMALSPHPLFCFAITMESHGPWSEQRLTNDEIANTLPDIPHGLFSRELITYLCHLRHMDQLFGLALDASPSGRSVTTWCYGDHAPGITINRPDVSNL
ncbi:LTA synthase family protein [Desulfovibrio sp. OttesenSCG-928-G11]|nr:LTA synthase family protein [Desulfovibrio sp. OttesenSCG-928-G11]